MKIFILGGTGFLGRHLIGMLLQQKHTISALVRNPKITKLSEAIKIQEGDARIPGKWQEEIATVDAVINLAGCTIAQTWTKEIKDEIMESRIQVTKNVVDAFPNSVQTKILINASAIGYYGFCGDEWCTENSPAGKDFLAQVCQSWENTAKSAEKKGIHVIIPRMGIVLGHGGSLEKMVSLFKRFIGSQLGSGKQWFSWVHIQDVLQFIHVALQPYCKENIFPTEIVETAKHIPSQKFQGIYNLCSPNPIQNKELTQTLAKVLQVPILVKAPTFAIRLALGEFANVVLEGQRVLPQRLLQAQFPFRFTHLEPALKSLHSYKHTWSEADS